MAKQQVNIRVSDMTRDKLDYLSTLYGTQAEAVAVAVDRLLQEHGSDTMSDSEMIKKMKEVLADYPESNASDEKVRVLIVDDEPNVMGNIRKMLQQLEIEVVGTAVTCEEGIQLAQELQPHIVLLDRLMPGMGGLAASQTITKQVPFARVIMTAVQGAESLRRSMFAGARDCLSRPFSIGDLAQSIYRVYAMSPYPSTD
ncbi:MAG: response regulator transcription factor [Chloroflexi bacterium]|nr:response regulator transcription factor [Chloroflexota bacterium]